MQRTISHSGSILKKNAMSFNVLVLTVEYDAWRWHDGRKGVCGVKPRPFGNASASILDEDIVIRLVEDDLIHF